MNLTPERFSTEPEYFIAGTTIDIAKGVKEASADIKAHAPVKLSAEGKLEAVSNAEDTEGLYGITAEEVKNGKEGVVYLTGEFFADSLALEAEVTADKLEVPFRNIGIFLVGVKKADP